MFMEAGGKAGRQTTACSGNDKKIICCEKSMLTVHLSASMNSTYNALSLTFLMVRGLSADHMMQLTL